MHRDTARSGEAPWRHQRPRHPADDGVRRRRRRPHGPAERSDAGSTCGMGGSGANVLRVEPSTASAVGGGDLISFDERDTRGIDETGRFGRRFVNNGLWFESPNKNFQFHVGGRTQMDSGCSRRAIPCSSAPEGSASSATASTSAVRIRLEGAMYENMLYVMEIDFVNTAM